MKNGISKKNLIVLIAFAVIMVGLGTSDALRGIFSGVFENEMKLTKVQVSWIVTASYIGNLIFMLFGSRIVDRISRKKACIGILAIWSLSMLLLCAAKSYLVLLIGMFFAMGASTLMNTMINILSPVLFGACAGTLVNVLFFIQGIGTSGSQKLLGTYGDSFHDFRLVCLGLMVIGAVTMSLLAMAKMEKIGKNEEDKQDSVRNAVARSEEAKQDDVRNVAAMNAGGNESETAVSFEQSNTLEGVSQKSSGVQRVILFGLVFGFYFVAEHGIMNWWSMYCQQGLALSNGKASTSVALFFGGITLGRLVFAPLVGKLGTEKSLKIMGAIGVVLYLTAIAAGNSGVYLMGAAGLFLSIIYPTLVLNLQRYFSTSVIAGMTGTIISIGTIFDILFNSTYGSIVERIGFQHSIIIFPVSMILFYCLLLVTVRTKKVQA